MGNYNKLSKEVQEKIEFDRQTGWKNPYACKEIIEDLPNKMKKYGIKNLRDIIGLAHK